MVSSAKSAHRPIKNGDGASGSVLVSRTDNEG